jgi:hypothetical protein
MISSGAGQSVALKPINAANGGRATREPLWHNVKEFFRRPPATLRPAGFSVAEAQNPYLATISPMSVCFN